MSTVKHARDVAFSDGTGAQGRRSAGTGQLSDPRTCGHKGQERASRMFHTRDGRIGGSKVQARLCFPSLDKEQQRGSSTKALVPKNTGALLPRKGRHRHRQTGSRRDHTKSRAMSSSREGDWQQQAGRVGDPRAEWRTPKKDRGGRRWGGEHETSWGAQVPGGRFGGQDQKGSLTRRSILRSELALLPSLACWLRWSIGGFGELACCVLLPGLLVDGRFHLYERDHLLIDICTQMQAMISDLSLTSRCS